ncbi:hypothetical protein C8J56DRAFT_1040339 [Mycena floridula]|nr:hypothetical protein C8J56DRAFT_1040339 [Mycena floridula]
MSSSTADELSGITLERSLYWGQIFLTWLYGEFRFRIHLLAVLMSYLFISSRNVNRFYIIFSGVMLVLTTIRVFTGALHCQSAWIDDRDGPGGPVEYLVASISKWRQVIGTAAAQIINIMGDSLLLYRCYVIYNGNWKVIIAPFFIHLGASAMALGLLVESTRPSNNFFDGLVVTFGVYWAALSVTLNVIVTALLVSRILQARRYLLRHSPDRARTINAYTGLMALLIESSLPFTVIGVAFAITYGKHLDIGTAFLFVWSGLAALSPQLIIFRIASGRAWNRRVFAGILDTTQIQSSSVISGVREVPHVVPAAALRPGHSDEHQSEPEMTFSKAE